MSSGGTWRRARSRAVAAATLLAIAATLLTTAARVQADEAPAFEIGSRPAYFLMGGVTTGGTLVARERGGYVGGELSVVRLREGRFVGVYGDGYHDFGAHRTYATTGVELGYRFLGVDGGGAVRLGGDRAEWGPTGRLFLTLGIVSLYGRYAYFPEALGAKNDHVVQIGCLVKLPFHVWGVK